MYSILSGIYSGEYVPPIQYAPRNEEYLDLRQRYHRHYDDLYKTLETINPDLAKRFAGIMEEKQELSLFDDEETFMGSFCLGAGLMVEIFQRNLVGKEV